MTITFEQLVENLTHPEIKILEHPHPNTSPAHFERNIFFEIRGHEYRIEWFVNTCNLFIGECIVCFNYVKQSGTWPNRFKTNLQFYSKYENSVFTPNKTCAIIPLEEYHKP